MANTLALVLAGGRGARLGALTAHRAKPAVPIGGRYRVIDFTLANCVNSGVPQVGVLTQYLAHTLAPHLEHWSGNVLPRGRWLRPLSARHEDAYGGTADAVHQNRDVIRTHAPSHVLVLAADHVYRMDYAAMLAAHLACGANVTVGCVEVPLREASAFGVVDVDGSGRITAFAEKPAAPRAAPGRGDAALVSMGIYLFDTAFLLAALADDAGRPGSTHDFGRDLIPAAVRSAEVHAHRLGDARDPARRAYWRDVGTVDAYWRANFEIASVAPELDPEDEGWPIRPGGKAARPARAESGAARHGCVVSAGVEIGAGSVVEESVLLAGARVGAGCVVRRAVIEEGCRIEDGTTIGVDPARDRARFHVSPMGVTLVAPEMLGPAV